MKKNKITIINKIKATLLVSMTVCSIMPITVRAEEKDAIVLYTNDVHCAIEDYSRLAAYSTQLEEQGHEVVIVDAGDAIQGEVIGGQTEGSAIVDLMNEVGYDYAVPGNHEFDYGMETFLELASSETSNYQYLSANFVDLRTNKTVFENYDVVELNGEKVAFIGVTTPETYTKSTPAYFQDENGNDIYGFSGENFYGIIQKAVDTAKEQGAERIIAMGHLGISGTTEGWRSTDVIANTTGIDVFIDAHSHEVIQGNIYKNKAGEEVLLTSTGTKFANFGQLNLNSDGTEETRLIIPETVDINSSETVKAAYDKVQKKIDGYNSEIAYLMEKIGTAESELCINDPDTGNRLVRKQETNAGDFTADAYRNITGADIAFVNGGGVRSSISVGDVTRKDLMNINPWNNEMAVVAAKGQQILDALEHGVSALPEESGGFLQTSGLTYEIHMYRESPVITDKSGNFVKIDKTKERRIANVRINGLPIEADKEYTVATTLYLLKKGGDGFNMFANSKIVKQDGLLVDSQMLIQYFTDYLNGVIKAEQYGNPMGDGRIVIYASKDEVPKKETLSEKEDLSEKEEVSEREDLSQKEDAGDGMLSDDSIQDDLKENEGKEAQELKTDDLKTEMINQVPKTGEKELAVVWILLAVISGTILVKRSLKSEN